MKTKIILILFVGFLFANHANLISQDSEPVHQPVNYCGNPNFLIFGTSPQFTQYKMFKGWMWDSRYVIDKAFYSNQGDNWYGDSFSKIGDSANLCVRSNRYDPALYCDHGGGTCVLMARAMVFNPALQIPDPITDYYAIANQCNQNNHSSVFGFKTIDNRAVKTNSGLVLYKNNFSGITKVLQYPWDIDELNFGDGEFILNDNVFDSSKTIQLFNGNKYYLTVNLQRLNDTDTTNGADPVISVKIFFFDPADSSTKSVNVRTLPALPADSINTFYKDKRGLQARQIQMTSQTDNIHIHKKDIPTNGTPITYSAYFTFFGTKTAPGKYFDNPRKPKNFNVEVTYFRNCNIKISEIKIETPHAKDLFAGKFDTTIIKNVQSSFNRYSCTDSLNNAEAGSVKSKHTNYFREITSVETGIRCWGAERYFNKLVGNIGSGAKGPEMPILYEAYVNPPDRWLEVAPARLHARVAAPYKRYFTDELDKDKALGIIGGYDQTRIDKGWRDTIIQLDTLNSGYETYLRFDECRDSLRTRHSKIDSMNYITYTDAGGRSYSLQYYWEDRLKGAYYDNFHSGFQYSNLKWWSMNLPSCEFRDYSWDPQYQVVRDYRRSLLDTALKYAPPEDTASIKNRIREYEAKLDLSKQYKWWLYYRPLTAEEVRLMDFSQLIYGAKGITYDGAICNRRIYLDSNVRKDTMNRTQLVFETNAYRNYEANYNSSTFNREKFILDKTIGGDFIDNVSRYLPRLGSTYYLKKDDNIPAKNDTCHKYFGCDTSRLPLGLASNRWEIYKIHRWINDNDQTLMSLHLLASYGKGFLRQYSQHPDYPLSPTDTLLDKYVKLRNITTRKLWQAKAFDPQHPLDSIYQTVPYSLVDSVENRYFDVTLLKCGNDDINYHRIIGIQNRRTDPLTFRQIKDTPLIRKLCYLTGNELDHLCDSGGVDPYNKNLPQITQSKEFWRSYYRKSAGNREISLPIKRLQAEPPRFETGYSWGYLVKELTYKFPKEGTKDFDSMRYWMRDAYEHQIYQFVPCSYSKISTYDSINVKLRPGEAKFLDIKTYSQLKAYKPVEINFPLIPSRPVPPILDTCDILRHGMRLGFIKVDTVDANNCVYNIYYENLSDSCHFYVPIQAAFITNNNKDTTYDIASGFQSFNVKRFYKFETIWLPDSALNNVRLLGKYKAHCDSTKVIFKLGPRDCYSMDSVNLPCHICECANLVHLNVAPISPYTMCKLIPLISQTYTLSSGQHCKYYGIDVTGGLTPTDNQAITSLSVPYNANTPIDFSTYNRWIPDPFMNIYCYPKCTYNLHYGFRNINNDVVANKDFSIMIDNSSIPINIIPSGLLSSQCYSIQPHKISIPSEELHFEEMVVVDPNPTTGKANVRLNLKEDLFGRLVLYSSAGEEIQEIHNGKLSTGFSDYGIDLSSQPSGMYIITIETDGMQYIKKFIKE